MNYLVIALVIMGIVGFVFWSVVRDGAKRDKAFRDMIARERRKKDISEIR